MLTEDQLSLVGAYKLKIIDIKTLEIFSETPILGFQQQMTLSLNEDFTGYKVKLFGLKDGELVEKSGSARWVDGYLVFYFPQQKNCQYSIKTLRSTVTMAKESFRGFLMSFELEKVMYCIRCER